MHIPNGYLSDPICAATTLAAAAGYGAGLWQARRAISTGSCRSLALAGAAIFAAQMINFPVDHGTSGHLVGAAAAAILLGPWAATLVMGVVLAAQAVLFGDGACATWGANMLTMGIAAPWTAWAVASALQRLRPRRRSSRWRRWPASSRCWPRPASALSSWPPQAAPLWAKYCRPCSERTCWWLRARGC